MVVEKDQASTRTSIFHERALSTEKSGAAPPRQASVFSSRKNLSSLFGRDDYEAGLCDVAFRADEDDMGLFLPSNVSGKGGPLPEEEEEEEWEMLDRLREEATRQPAMMKQRETQKPAPPAPQVSSAAAGAASGPRGAPNSKQFLVATIMADKNLSPAERQRKVNRRENLFQTVACTCNFTACILQHAYAHHCVNARMHRLIDPRITSTWGIFCDPDAYDPVCTTHDAHSLHGGDLTNFGKQIQAVMGRPE